MGVCLDLVGSITNAFVGSTKKICDFPIANDYNGQLRDLFHDLAEMTSKITDSDDNSFQYVFSSKNWEFVGNSVTKYLKKPTLFYID
ncbi:hypothetical protein FACS1894113_2060 [Alphaproteobacteria bacterium]|nr:hypothetical protein FACS1894113_2060 [Alphaproteobacteria bacterium]